MDRRTGFLNLPREVILLCLWDLPFEDIKRCRTLNRQIYNFISSCAYMRYRAKQDMAGVEENHCAFQGQQWAIPEKVSKLHDLEKRWLEFRPTAVYKFDVPDSGIPKVTSDYFLVPHDIGGESKAVKYIQTSSGGCECELKGNFTFIDFVKPFVAFGAAIEEHDLIAAVHFTHDPSKEPSEDTSSFHSLDVQFLRFSVGEPHPLASQPILHIGHLPSPKDLIVFHIEIAGKTLALSVMGMDDDTDDHEPQIGWSTVYLYDWQCGSPIITPHTGCGSGLVFLTSQILLTPRPDNNTLDVFCIPPVGTTPCELADHMIVSFRLPELLDRESHHWVECFSANCNSSAKGVPGHAPFDNVAHKAIVRFLYVDDDSDTEVVGSDNSDTEEVGSDKLQHNFFILREPVMHLINQFSKRCEPKPQVIEWPHWGPQCSHMVTKAANNTDYYECSGTSAGQRAVILNNSTPTPISILDFNQYTVNTYRDRQATNASAGASIRVIEPDAICSFAEPVRCIETLTKESFQFNDVMINSQNIFGMTFEMKNDHFGFELTIFHFG